jgi:hypothetical protein
MNRLIIPAIFAFAVSTNAFALEPLKSKDDRDKAWQTLALATTTLSAQQHRGNPDTSSFCQVELKICSEAVTYIGTDKKLHMVRENYDPNHKLIQREVCDFNLAQTERKCEDFDTGIYRKEVKKSNRWFIVETINPNI